MKQIGRNSDSITHEQVQEFGRNYVRSEFLSQDYNVEILEGENYLKVEKDGMVTILKVKTDVMSEPEFSFAERQHLKNTSEIYHAQYQCAVVVLNEDSKVIGNFKFV